MFFLAERAHCPTLLTRGEREIRREASKVKNSSTLFMRAGMIYGQVSSSFRGRQWWRVCEVLREIYATRGGIVRERLDNGLRRIPIESTHEISPCEWCKVNWRLNSYGARVNGAMDSFARWKLQAGCNNLPRSRAYLELSSSINNSERDLTRRFECHLPCNQHVSGVRAFYSLRPDWVVVWFILIVFFFSVCWEKSEPSH